MADKARLLAAKALVRVSAGGFSNIVLDKALEDSNLEGRDRSFASALFYGTLERRITIDYLIKVYSKIPKEKMSPEVLETLRMGFYQILYMSGVPDNAAVNESVNLAKDLGEGKASGFINGVLRSFLRDGKEKALMNLKGFDKMSAAYSAPVWLCRMLVSDFGMERAKEALKASLGTPPTFLKTNTGKVSAAGLKESLGKLGIECEILDEDFGTIKVNNASPQNTKEFKDGLFHVQDLSSQLCVKAVDAKKGMRVLDICAAPGGKTFSLAEAMENDGEILSCDLHPKRAGLIAEGAKRLGLSIVKAMANDASIENPKFGTFDRILCDVPCSGLGVIRRKPEIRFKNPLEIKTLPGVQYKIASTSAQYLKPDGKLIYSTCTIAHEENMDVVKKLMERDGLVPAKLPEELLKFSKDGFTVTLLPGEIDSDGFFFASLQKGKE